MLRFISVDAARKSLAAATTSLKMGKKLGQNAYASAECDIETSFPKLRNNISNLW